MVSTEKFRKTFNAVFAEVGKVIVGQRLPIRKVPDHGVGREKTNRVLPACRACRVPRDDEFQTGPAGGQLGHGKRIGAAIQAAPGGSVTPAG